MTVTSDVKDTAGHGLTADYSWSFTVTPPRVTAINPSNGQTDVPTNTTISAAFSGAMDPSSFTTSTFLVDNGTTGLISYDAATKTATFTPSALLTAGTTYTVTITTGVRDSAGKNFPSDFTWTFTTTGPSPHHGGTTPADIKMDFSGGCYIVAALTEQRVYQDNPNPPAFEADMKNIPFQDRFWKQLKPRRLLTFLGLICIIMTGLFIATRKKPVGDEEHGQTEGERIPVSN